MLMQYFNTFQKYNDNDVALHYFPKKNIANEKNFITFEFNEN